MAKEDLSREQEAKAAEEPECAPQEDEIGELKQALAQEKQKAETYLANWQRAQADYINNKRRSEQERQEITQMANCELIVSILPVLDDMERAFSALPDKLATAGWVQGVKMVGHKLRTKLEAQGLMPLQAVGEKFDPRLHEAVKEAEGKEGIVLEELEKGYKLHDKIIRPSKVVVGKGEKTEEVQSRDASL
jgi:molecular chaperone GrpE